MMAATIVFRKVTGMPRRALQTILKTEDQVLFPVLLCDITPWLYEAPLNSEGNFVFHPCSWYTKGEMRPFITMPLQPAQVEISAATVQSILSFRKVAL